MDDYFTAMMVHFFIRCSIGKQCLVSIANFKLVKISILIWFIENFSMPPTYVINKRVDTTFIPVYIKQNCPVILSKLRFALSKSEKL